MHYRKAVKEDIEALCRIRKQQLIDEGIEPNADRTLMNRFIVISQKNSQRALWWNGF